MPIPARHHRSTLAGGTEFAFTQVLIATGSCPRRLQLPDADLDGVCYPRNRDHSEHLGRALRAACATQAFRSTTSS
ncbi:hypothetical protein [Nonomuraea glycinis]|uniref:hypothetical protein n=1 Tax=Nonomuraea glycinis TaxID=2047744 RepID=UPI002E0EFE4A|nr:hypothetical protein OHA68_09155 [Nonomuraea glycinis]